jgi:hypothetical protein
VILRLSRELLEEGMKLENLPLICDALFYYARSQEYRTGRESYSDVLGYLAALEFIERATAWRRIQILLTQGSVHRHYCRAQLPWDEFVQHMEEGFKFYSRSFLSAVAQKEITHILNSTAYMIDFCLKSLRFSSKNMMIFHKVVDKCQKTLERSKDVITNHASNIVRAGDKNIFRSVQNGYPILLYICTLADPNRDGASVEILKQSFGDYIESLLEEMNSNGSSRNDRNVARVLDNMYYTFVFGKEYVSQMHNRFISELQPSLCRLLTATQSMKHDRRLRSAWAKLSSMVAC